MKKYTMRKPKPGFMDPDDLRSVLQLLEDGTRGGICHRMNVLTAMSYLRGCHNLSTKRIDKEIEIERNKVFFPVDGMIDDPLEVEGLI